MASKISPVRAVSIGSNLSRTLRGRNDAVAVRNINDFQVRDARGSATFESMYDSSLDTMLHGTGKETFDAVKLMQDIQKRTYTPANGAAYPNGPFGQSLLQIARLIKADAGLEVVAFPVRPQTAAELVRGQRLAQAAGRMGMTVESPTKL